MSTESRVHERCACGSSHSSYRADYRADGASTFTLEGTRRVYERSRPFRIDHIALELELDVAERRFAATAELTIVRVDAEATEVSLDGVGFDIARVELSRGRGKWRAASFVYDGEVLTVPFARTERRGVLRVRYTTKPRRGMYFLAPDEAVPERPLQVWTQCQDEDARHVFPCHDKPHVRQTMDVQVKAPPGWFVLSNGERAHNPRQERAGHYRYRMAEPMPSYLFTMVAGSFAVIDAGKVGELPVTYYVPTGKEEEGQRTFARTPEMIRLFAERTGVAFPWSKYAQIVVSDFIFGGMENTGATTMYEHVLLDERAALDISSDDLIAHELAHQWFGDLVTCRDWSHAWLNEGFATYFEHVWREHALGRDEYEESLRADLGAYLSEAGSRYRRPVVCQDYDAPIDIFDRHLYEKGALTLHGLRLELGDDAFFEGLKLYLSRHRGGEVETRDLMRALEHKTGKSLERRFDEALHRAGHPRVEVTVEYHGGMLAVTAKQSLDAGEAPFTFALELDVCEAEKTRPRREVRLVDEAVKTFALPLPERPRYVVVDPRLFILGSVRTKLPADLAKNQLKEAPTARGRLLAAQALEKRDDAGTVRALGDALDDAREFWGVRSAAASALGQIRSDDARERLAAAASAKHPKVRRAVIAALGNFKATSVVVLLEKAARNDRSYLVQAAACRALGATKQEAAFAVLRDMLDVPSWASSVMAAAAGGLARLRDERGVELLRERTRYGVPTRGRRAAISALAELDQGRATRELLEELLHDHDPYLRVDVVEALVAVGDVKARPALEARLACELDGRVRRRVREALRELGQKGTKETRRLRDEVLELKREQAELKARLTRLEARHQDKPGKDVRKSVHKSVPVKAGARAKG